MVRIDNRVIFIIIVAIVLAVVVDTSIVAIATSTGGMKSSFTDISLFTLMVVIFALGQFVILRYIKSKFLNHANETGTTTSHVQWMDRITTIVQYVLVMILTSIVFQIAFFSSYHIYSLISVMLISYGLSLLLLSLLAKRFLSWYRLNRNSVVLFYGLAITVISLNAVITILYVNFMLTDKPLYIQSIRSLTGSLSNPDVVFDLAYTSTAIIFFILTWIATVLLLKHYSKKIGNIKYWILVSIPLVYFLSQFQPLFLFTFSEYRMSDPVLFGIVYTMLFSLSKPLGGVLFGVAFWMVSRSLKDTKVKGYLIISAYGMTLLFASNQPTSLILAPYPPFGLVTISFMGLASYLLYLGVYSSALSVSEDSRLRQIIRNETLKESQKFLDMIGTAEMEQEIQRKVLRFSKKTKDLMEYETGISTSLDDNDVKRYLEEVLIELKSMKKNNHEH